MKGPVEVVNSSSDSNKNTTTSSTIIGPFAEYLWMAEVEEFDQKVLEELQEEEFMQACMEEMLLEEEADCYYPCEHTDGDVATCFIAECLSRISVEERRAMIDEDSPDS
ncbi:polyadenylate-binding protein-interacting protein 2B-like [Glandiceps talaboti]